MPDKSAFQFTPGQVNEALTWIKDNCPELYALIEGDKEGKYEQDTLMAVDMYFKLKNVPFSFKPHEFVVGIEYKQADKIKLGLEMPNVKVHNPHPRVAEQYTHDVLALAILMNLLNQLKR